MTHNKYLTLRFFEDNDPISAKSAASEVSRVVLLPVDQYGIPNSHPKKSQKIKKYMLKKSLNYGYLTLNEQLYHFPQ